MFKVDVRGAFFGAVFTLLLVFGVTSVALAQTDELTVVTDDVDVAEVSDFTDEGLGDDDLTADLEAEALPTADWWAYRWERWIDGVISVFTFNSERKAEQLRARLHKLDRKLEACAEIGDTKCAEKIEARIEKMQERTEKYIAKREELKGQFQDRFEIWRDRRELRKETLELNLNERKVRHEELLEERNARREQAVESRVKHIERRKALMQGRRDDLQENRLRLERRGNAQEGQDRREKNRERLIEVRSSNLKNRLDDTRLKVDDREAELQEAIDTVEQ